MKFTVIFVTLLSISWAIKVKKVDPKDKREAAVGYASSSHGYPSASLGHEAGGAGGQISIGAGYSIGGAKPSFSYGLPEGASLQQLSSEGLQSNGHGTIQLAPITLQPGQGFGQEDLHQLMSQISQGLNSGAISIPNFQADGGAHGSQEAASPQFSFGAPSFQLQQYSGYEQSSVPSYAAGSKGLGSYGSTGPVLFNPADSHSSQASLSYAAPASGHSFADSGSSSIGDAGHSFAGLSGHSFDGASLSQASSGHYGQGGAGQSHGGAGHSLGGSGLSFSGAGHSLGNAGHSLGSSGLSLGGAGHSFGNAGHSLGGAGHSFGGAGLSFGGAGLSHGGPGLSLSGLGYSMGGSGHSLSGSGNLLSSPAHSYGGPGLSLGGGHSLGNSGLSLGGSGHSFGGSLKSLSGYSFPGKASFKPSAYVGSLSQGDSSHAMSLGGHSFPGGHSGLSLSSASHGPSFSGGSSKYIMQTYLPSKSESFPSFAAYSANAHSSSPPGTTYGTPSASYLPANSAHAASSHKPYYVMSKSSSPSFGKGSFRAPMSHGHSSLSSYSSPKYSFGGQSASSYPKYEDAHGAHSETSYNTIKYSEELKPRSH